MLVEASNYLNSRLSGRTFDDAKRLILEDLKLKRAELNDITARVSWRDIHDNFPFVEPTGAFGLNYWTMSQRAGSVTYLLFAAGFACVVYAAFLVLCDRRGWQWGYLDLLGRHALAGYVIHEMVSEAVKPFVPKDSPAWYVALGFAVYLGVITLFLRHLDRHKLYLRL